jgi:hypothetical protein
MEAARLERNESGTFNVIDARNGKTVKCNLRGYKAAAYVRYYNQEVKKAEAFWAE